jgi:hypothetical protein
VGNLSNKDNASIKQLKWEMKGNMKKSRGSLGIKKMNNKNKKKNKSIGNSKKKNLSLKLKKNKVKK